MTTWHHTVASHILYGQRGAAGFHTQLVQMHDLSDLNLIVRDSVAMLTANISNAS